MNTFADPNLTTPPAEPPELHRILIVDDEPRLRESLALLLAAEKREIRQAGNGAEAIAEFGHGDFDLALLDLRLPDMSGLDIMDWLHRNKISPAIIVVSADDHIESAIAALRKGAAEYVRKPYEPEAICRTVENHLVKRSLERRHALLMARLEQSERLHRFLVEQSPDIIYTLDNAGRFMFINSRIEHLLGYDKGELVGKHYSTIVHEEDRERARYAFNERRSGYRATSNAEIRLKCKNDGFRHFDNRFIVAMLSSVGIYEEDDGNPMQRFMGTYGVARDITERKKAEETISFQAFHDLLTHLPNRNLFRDHLELAMARARRQGSMVGIMFVDLDRFKLVNDTYGHAEGDALLKGFAQRMRNCLRESDTLARQGGDEFTVVLPDLAYPEDAAVIAEKFFHSLKEPFVIAGQDFRATASVGIAVYPRDGEDADSLIKHADIAMYQVKAKGRNGYQFFTAAMSESYQTRLSMENDLRRALEQKEFELHFQPQVSVSEGRTVGMEALIRWRHPEHGLIDPGSFVNLAEEAGLIRDISDWVLEQACAQLARWRQGAASELRMSVNLSPKDFERSDLVDRVLRQTKEHGIPEGVLEVEITENLLLKDAESVIEKVRRLRQEGIRVSIDDFGTRYSSLNYLRRFPISSLKIDQSFVRSLGEPDGTEAIIRAIVSIAEGFGLHLVAEGVENYGQLAALTDMGCDEVQGYLFSRPLPATEAEAWLRQGKTTVPVAH
ncbi:MAG TPA: EAL domain-containing protein [Rhodocyclaceae bacterium]|nr:EAL domain-containing protein [Rhodocyclaceae bacterium]HNH34982.1 EAL domain-containing protein [Rhodocyclaceae bacterium]